MITEWNWTISSSEFTVISWKFLLEMGGEGREGRGGVPWGQALQTKEDRAFILSGGLWDFHLQQQTLLSILSKENFIKTQDYLYFFPPTFPAVHSVPVQCSARWQFLFFCVYLLWVQSEYWKCRGMPMPEPVDVNTQLLKSSPELLQPDTHLSSRCHPELQFLIY